MSLHEAVEIPRSCPRACPQGYPLGSCLLLNRMVGPLLPSAPEALSGSAFSTDNVVGCNPPSMHKKASSGRIRSPPARPRRARRGGPVTHPPLVEIGPRRA
jgi:hypothetical protein